MPSSPANRTLVEVTQQRLYDNDKQDSWQRQLLDKGVKHSYIIIMMNHSLQCCDIADWVTATPMWSNTRKRLLLLLLFWHAPLGLRSVIRRHQPPQRTVLGQVDWFIQCEVVGSQIALDGVKQELKLVVLLKLLRSGALLNTSTAFYCTTVCL